MSEGTGDGLRRHGFRAMVAFGGEGRPSRHDRSRRFGLERHDARRPGRRQPRLRRPADRDHPGAAPGGAAALGRVRVGRRRGCGSGRADIAAFGPPYL
ncbi:hypothetical protein MTBSS4_50042 [Magnetospirillum sp. SS-4]|nr:hypothetical protein MTBSS4_50042 [Magnetospirillum sp. SS-4]